MTAAAQRRAAADAPARRPLPVRVTWLLVALLGLGLFGAASIVFGVRAVTWPDVVGGLSGASDTIAEAAVLKRVPRTILAMLVGAALGLAGAVMQGVTRNPLADPGILGVTTGASLAVVTGIAFFGLSAPTTVTWVAIGGAAAAAVLVYTVGSLGRGGATPLKLALAGAASSAAFSSLISAVLLPRIDALTQFRFWQVGGVGGAEPGRILQVLPFLLVGAVVCVLSARGMNSLALGDDVAAGLGAHVGRTRLVAAAGAILLCGAATAVAGPIGFVGLAVPHLCRLLVGLDHRWLLPASAVAGAALLTGADVIGRLVARPAEVDVGIITAIVGAPIFIWIVRRQKVRAL
ncbi:FecCD family ABC transporter permease [Amnibacterium kyonggiense]|uniref:Iron complex transport system permease protein n=1 Tax=Amnibacterium kyonggiense TaxID=595671 RepID=A0A4R7FQK8_9MICO|nr:iron ABC transporter permease [Amnibacterium kyonggiense]TDS79968.1 iron complex transport system permease protein [Amnibacterium kyonggiense]